jgi:hypothetical protein
MNVAAYATLPLLIHALFSPFPLIIPIAIAIGGKPCITSQKIDGG